jgi:hypothetical protein
MLARFLLTLHIWVFAYLENLFEGQTILFEFFFSRSSWQIVQYHGIIGTIQVIMYLTDMF